MVYRLDSVALSALKDQLDTFWRRALARFSEAAHASVDTEKRTARITEVSSATVLRSVTVPVSPAEAFALFTEPPSLTSALGSPSRSIFEGHGVVVLLRRRHRRSAWPAATSTIALLATAVFTVATFGLLALAVDSLRISDGNGAGQWLSGAIVAVPIALFYAVRYVPVAAREP
jgi:hypothetical protein